MRSPTDSHIEEPSMPLAFPETTTVSSGSQLSSARMAVMIFVVEAIGICSYAFSSSNTRPVEASIRIEERAETPASAFVSFTL